MAHLLQTGILLSRMLVVVLMRQISFAKVYYAGATLLAGTKQN